MQQTMSQDNNEDFSLLQRQESNDVLKSLENTSEMALMQREEANSKLDDISRTLDMQLEQSNGVQKVQITPPETDEEELLDWAKSSFIQMLRGPRGKEGKAGQDSKPEEVAKVLKNDEEFVSKTKGEDGYSPIKGRDYDDGKDGYTPIKGVDYFDGKDSDPVEVASLIKKDSKFVKSLKGEKGDTPIVDTETIAKKVAKQINLQPETPETIIDKIKDKLSFSDLKDIPMYLRKVASKTVSLLELDDVSVTNPTNGQSLTYSATLRKWVNSTISGSGITLKTNGTDNGDQTLLNLVGGTNVTLTDNGTGSVTIDATGGSGSGDVTGPASSTDNALARFDGTTGKIIQNSVGTLDDTGILSVASGIISGTNGAGHINLRHQASDATATGQSTAIFADSNGDFKYKNDGNFYTTLKTSLNTADRTYTYPDATGNLALKGTLAANQIAYATDTNTIASLDTATYPSLTELSYVKGVTSAIQTQINAKEPTITTLAVNKGGTGQTSYTNGQLLIGNTTGNTLTKATLTGTSNQVVVTNGTGSITLSTPQDIGTSSNPQFATIELGAASDTTLSRSAAGVLAVEGVVIPSVSSTNTLTNKTIRNTVEPGTDDTYTGEDITGFNATATIAQWDAVYLSTTGWALTDADAASTAGGVMVGLAAAAGTSSNPLTVVTRGIIRNDGWTWATVGAPLYLSTTAGALTETAPSGTDDVVRIVGYVMSDDCIFFNPSNDWITRV